MPAGRPPTELSDLPSDWKDQMKALAKAGKSELATRVTLGIGTTVWYRLKAENEEFRETVKECLGLCQLWWEDVGQEGMFMGGKDNPFNSTVYTFNMSNRFGWSMKNENKTDVTSGGEKITGITREIVKVKN